MSIKSNLIVCSTHQNNPNEVIIFPGYYSEYEYVPNMYVEYYGYDDHRNIGELIKQPDEFHITGVDTSNNNIVQLVFRNIKKLITYSSPGIPYFQIVFENVNDVKPSYVADVYIFYWYYSVMLNSKITIMGSDGLLEGKGEVRGSGFGIDDLTSVYVGNDSFPPKWLGTSDSVLVELTIENRLCPATIYDKNGNVKTVVSKTSDTNNRIRTTLEYGDKIVTNDRVRVYSSNGLYAALYNGHPFTVQIGPLLNTLGYMPSLELECDRQHTGGTN